MSSQIIKALNQVINSGIQKELLHRFTEDQSLNGRIITIDGQELINFGSCSYLGLEHHPALKQGVIDAVERYGTQFSSSRTYASLGIYKDLEDQLMAMFERPVIVTASTTLGHLATIPVIVGENDAVILDMQVHNSVQMAVQQLKANGIFVTLIRHNDMDSLESKIQQLRNKYDKIWYFADGVYSMYGDYAPLGRLEELMNKYEQFHLYIDDAHGMSWTGPKGTGYVCSQLFYHEKMVLAGSLNKSFATSGGFVALPNARMAQDVRNCGGTLIFTGPIQPPMLGAALASTQLHCSEDILPIWDKVHDMVDFTNGRIEALGLPQFEVTNSPLFFIPAGIPRITTEMVSRMMKDGYYLNAAGFPATPMKRGGVRFMVNGNLEKEDVGQMLDALAYHYPRVLADEGSSEQKVSRVFSIPEFSVQGENNVRTLKPRTSELLISQHNSIHELDAQQWDELMGNRGNFTHSSLQMLERTFRGQEQDHDNWDFRYLHIADKSGKTILNTFFTSVTLKDDMFAPAEVSREIEEERRHNPTYLTSKTIILGTPITKGNHLWLDREHPEWKSALSILIQKMQRWVEAENATQLMLREFRMGADEELKNFLLEQGLIEIATPHECLVTDLSWADHTEYLQRLGGKYRYNVRKEILPYLDDFELNIEKPTSTKEIQECYDLYCNVFNRSLEMNVHKLPLAFFESICCHDDYDIIRLYLKTDEASAENRAPVAVMFSHKREKNYHALIVGLDYDYVRTYNTYKQMLYRTVWRAWDLDCTHLDLAFTAELEKKKIGARPFPTCIYVQSMDHFNSALISSMGKPVTRLRQPA